MNTPLLEITGLTKRFGGLTAVNQLDFTVLTRDIHAVIGPNGSGKTTVFNLLSGMLPVSAGRIRFAGASIETLPAHVRVRHGMRRTFQNIRLFEELSVRENILLGQHSRTSTGLASLLRIWSAAERRLVQEAEAAASRVGIAGLLDRPAGQLPYGRRRLVEIARSLVSDPTLLLLDEPTAGMNPAEAEGLCAIIRGIRDDGVTVLLVEHNLKVISGVATRVTAINFGEKIAEGSPAEVLTDSKVIEAYIGPPDQPPGEPPNA